MTARFRAPSGPSAAGGHVGTSDVTARLGGRRRSRLLSLASATAAALAVIAVLAPPAGATVLEKLSIEDLARRADSVLLVKVGSPRPQWATGALGAGSKVIETQVDVSVVDVLKGTPKKGAVKRLYTLGGKVGEVALEVDGLPRWQAGETCLLFLDAKGRVIGGKQGKVTVGAGSFTSAGQPFETVRERVNRALGKDADGSVGVPVKAPPPGLVGAQALSPVFFDDFEHAGQWGAAWYPLSGGWRMSNRGLSGGWSMHPDASPTYGPDEQKGVIAGPISLVDANAARLEFDMYLDSVYGEGFVTPVVQRGEVATGSVWPFVSYWQATSWTGDSGGAWEHMTVDLGNFVDSEIGPVSFVGDDDVYVGLVWTTDSVTDTTREGVFIDNVKVSKGNVAVPVVSGISPPSASAGTNTNVTIAGSKFGAARGSVWFAYSEGEITEYIASPVVSWSDTRIVCTVPTDVVNGYPVSAGSGPVYVVTAEGGRSTGTPFHVTFGYDGKKWGSNTVRYRVNPSGLLPSSLTAVQQAAGMWNGAGSGFTFVYDGQCDTLDVTQDFRNDVFWCQLEPGVIGISGAWIYNDETIAECDTGFNTDYAWTTTPDPDKMDVKTIAAHELGHWLALRDLYCDDDYAKVMYGYGAEGMVKTLHADDAAGIKWIYPVTPTPVIKSAGFQNPVAYKIASLLTTKMVATIDQSNVNAKIVVKTSLGDWTIYNGPIANTANQPFTFPVWNGKQPGTGKQAPYAASYDWTLTVTKNGKTATKSGKILLSQVYFVRKATSGANVELKHTGYLTGSSAKPMSVNLYVTASAASTGKLSVRTVLGSYNKVPSNTPWNVGPGVTAWPTAQLTGTARLTGTGIYAFYVKGSTGVSYAISVIE